MFVCSDDGDTSYVVRVTHSPETIDNPLTVVTFAVTITPECQGTVTYNWNFGDGNTSTVTTSTVTHAFQTSGTYNVQLSLTNNDGCNLNQTIPITVNNRVPSRPTVH